MSNKLAKKITKQITEILDKGKYWKHIQRWRRFYPEGQIFCGLYDDVMLRPSDLLERIARFIGVDPGPMLRRTELQQRVNTVPASNIPSPIRNTLREYYQPEVDALRDNLGLDVSNWLK